MSVQGRGLKRCTGVLDTSDYHKTMAELVGDNDTNEALKREPTARYKMKVIDCLQGVEKEKATDRPTCYHLYPGESTPCIYGLPKIQKDGVPLRPIVSRINSTTHNIATHLANVLAPLVGNTITHQQLYRFHWQRPQTGTGWNNSLFWCHLPFLHA